jgi:hypothetical protein
MSRICELHGGEVSVVVVGTKPEPPGCASRGHRYPALDPRCWSGGGSSAGCGTEHEARVSLRGGVTTRSSGGASWITTI